MKTNEVLETIKARRSVRAYDRKQIPADDLNAILEAGAYAPNGMHYETWHFTAVRNTVKLEELNERSKGHFPKVMTSIFGNGGTVRRIAITIMPQPLVIVSNEPKQWWPGWIVPVLSRICFWQPLHWASSCWINQLGTTCDDPEVRAYLTSLGVPENHKVSTAEVEQQAG